MSRLRALVRGRGASVALRVLIVGVSLGVLFWRLDVPGAFGRLRDVELWWLLPALLAFTASKFIHSYRWRFFLNSRPELSTRRLAPVFLLSNMVNGLIPLRAGDLLRVELPSRRYRVPRAELASSVFLVESVLDGVAFIVLLGVALITLDLPDALRPFVAAAVAVALAAFVASVVAARAPVRRDVGSSTWLRRLPHPLQRRLVRWIPQFVDGMRTLRTNRQVASAIVISLAAWLTEVPVYWMLARAFELEPSMSEAVILMIAANLIVSIPLTPWDFGPYEIAVTEAFVLIGASRVDASAFALGSHVLLQLWIAVTGVAAMWWLDLSPRDLLLGGAGREEAARKQPP